jgi:hypothetical protein
MKPDFSHIRNNSHSSSLYPPPLLAYKNEDGISPFSRPVFSLRSSSSFLKNVKERDEKE